MDVVQVLRNRTTLFPTQLNCSRGVKELTVDKTRLTLRFVQDALCWQSGMGEALTGGCARDSINTGDARHSRGVEERRDWVRLVPGE